MKRILFILIIEIFIAQFAFGGSVIDKTSSSDSNDHLITYLKEWSGNNKSISFVSLYHFVNTLERVEDDAQHVALLQEITKEVIDRIDKIADKEEIMSGRLQVLLEINAMLNAKMGNIKIAKKQIERASTLEGERNMSYYRDSKANYYKRCAIVLSAAGDVKAALDTLTMAVKNGDSNPALREAFKNIYFSFHKKDADTYISSLQKMAYEVTYKGVEEKMIKDPVIPFEGIVYSPNVSEDGFTLFTAKEHLYNISLPDLNGNVVSMSQHKGEIVVLDFWTTLCTPCVAAFTGFDKVVAEYDKKDVQLYVVNLFEEQETVKDYINDKGITLDVLQDQENLAYDIQGTPTKLIFDRKGNLRFFTMGYSGSTDREYYKTKAMIEIIKSSEGVDDLEYLQTETDQKKLKQKIATLEKGSAGEINILTQYYEKGTKQRENAIKLLLNKHPNSQEAKMARLSLFLELGENLNDSEDLYKWVEKESPGADLDLEKCLVAQAFAEPPVVDKFMFYLNSIENDVFRAYALTLVIDIIRPIDSKLALEIADREFVNVQKIKDIDGSNMLYDKDNAYYSFLDIYGKLLFAAGREKEAYSYIKEVYNNIDKLEDVDKNKVTEHYAFLSSKIEGKSKEAFPILESVVRSGNKDKRYIDELLKGYSLLYPGKDGTFFINSLQEDFIEKISLQIKEFEVNKPAPNFYVTDVNGKAIHLEDLKGCTILIDFWATWCGPCVASFPAMKLAVDRYKNDPTVKFMFVHTFENVDNPLEKAKEFLKLRDYDFDLYIDSRDPETNTNPAAASFGVTGIPVKYIIDAKGIIRFEVIGFKGTDQEAAEEVVQMIESARK